MDEYTRYVELFNQKSRWNKWQICICWITIIFYPLYWIVYTRIKKSKFLKVSSISTKNLINYKYCTKGLKVSKNADYTNIYFDIFDYKKINNQYITSDSNFLFYLSG